MPACPRCGHPAQSAPTVCTQCGCPVPAEISTAGPTSPVKLILAVIAVLLVAALIVLAIFYLRQVGQLVR